MILFIYARGYPIFHQLLDLYRMCLSHSMPEKNFILNEIHMRHLKMILLIIAIKKQKPDHQSKL